MTKNNQKNLKILLIRKLIINPKKTINESNKISEIIGFYEIKKEDSKQKIQFINFFESDEDEYKKYNNKKDFEESINLLLNDKKIEFIFENLSLKEGKYTLIIQFKKQLHNLNNLFFNCSCLKSLDFSNFNILNINNMGSMFYNCSSLININLSKLNTNKVTDMSSMFANCSSLKSLDLSNFNTINVTNMNDMFFSVFL